MEENAVNLMQYAIGGASLFVLIAVGIIALFIKRREARLEKEEVNTGKKEEQSPLQQTKERQQPSQKQPSPKQQVKQAQKVVQQKEVAPNPANNQRQQELQELQQRQVMQKLRQTQQEHIKQAIQSPPVQREEVLPQEPVQANPKQSEMKTLEIAFYKVQTTGRGENKAFFLDEYLTVGRTEGANDWVIYDDPTVSGNHCRIYQKEGKVYILDLNSTNGTYVNEERVFGEMQIENHDKIRMGQSVYRVKF